MLAARLIDGGLVICPLPLVKLHSGTYESVVFYHYDAGNVLTHVTILISGLGCTVTTRDVGLTEIAEYLPAPPKTNLERFGENWIGAVQ